MLPGFATWGGGPVSVVENDIGQETLITPHETRGFKRRCEDEAGEIGAGEIGGRGDPSSARGSVSVMAPD